MMKKKNQYRKQGSHLFPLLLAFCLLFCADVPVTAQSKSRTRLKAYYEKLENNDRKVSIILTQGSGKSIRGVQNAQIVVSTVDQDSTIRLATLNTDLEGETVFYIEENYTFPKNEEGYSELNFKYKGSDSLRSSKKSVEFLDLSIDISFDIVDSVKYVQISTYEIDSTGSEVPIGEIDVNVGVERLYSTLYLEEVETDDEGIATMEFPNDIPGDSIGMITVMIKIVDDDDYGTVTQSAKIDWGIPVDYSLKTNGRSLFSDEAPLWMIIAVAIVLIGAWYHFLLAVFRVSKIKNI